MNKLADNTIYLDLLSRVASQVDLGRFKSKVILVTGASGLIGSAIVDLLLYLNENHDADLRVAAVGRDVARLQERFGVRPDLVFIKYADVLCGRGMVGVDYIVLAASPASPNLFVEDPEAVLKANTDDVKNILVHAKKLSVGKVCYVSSSEVYGDAIAPEGGHIENVLGKIDERETRSCYAIGKRQAEGICCHCVELDVTIVRPGHIYGPTALMSDKRVSSIWPREVAVGHDIIMKSAGSQIRSYTHCLDCASAILTVLTKGMPGEAYNISNPESVITIRQLAERLCNIAGVKLKCDTPSFSDVAAFNPMLNSSLNASKLEALGWRGMISENCGLSSTVKILSEIYK